MKALKKILKKPWLRNQYLTIIQLIISIVFLGMLLIEMPVLPVLYLIILIIVLVLFLLITYVLQYDRDFFSVRGIISKFIAIIVSMALSLAALSSIREVHL